MTAVSAVASVAAVLRGTRTSNVVHEGRHAIDLAEGGYPQTPDEVFAAESRAYQAEWAFERAVSDAQKINQTVPEPRPRWGRRSVLEGWLEDTYQYLFRRQ
jgi:hypothetical protein